MNPSLLLTVNLHLSHNPRKHWSRQSRCHRRRPRKNSNRSLNNSTQLFDGRKIRLDQKGLKAGEADQAGGCAFWFVDEFLLRIVHGGFDLRLALTIKGGELGGL